MCAGVLRHYLFYTQPIVFIYHNKDFFFKYLNDVLTSITSQAVPGRFIEGRCWWLLRRSRTEKIVNILRILSAARPIKQLD